MTLGEVFVPGGQPTITYVPRGSLALEESLNRALERGHSLVSVTGPTKSGKTVLCRKVISSESAIWLTGGDFKNESQFWDAVAQKLELPSEVTSSSTSNRSSTVSGQVSFGIGVGANRTQGSTKSNTQTRRTTSKTVSLEGIVGNQRVLIIDDFHYLDPDTQTSIVRALKQRIFDGAKVVVLAVPHRAYDAVKVENEMTGRVHQVRISKWEENELAEIATNGFKELGVITDTRTMTLLCEQSFGSPHLMQTFCYNICYDHEIKERQVGSMEISIKDEKEFFGRVAADASKTAFERLAMGPRQRSDRIPRKFKDGESGDIYIAVLKAIAATGPASRLTYEEIRSQLRDLLAGTSLRLMK